MIKSLDTTALRGLVLLPLLMIHTKPHSLTLPLRLSLYGDLSVQIK